MLGSSTRTMLFLLVCIGLLSDNRYKVSAMRNREFFLTQTQGAEPDAIAKLKSISLHFKDNIEDQEMLGENRRILEEVNKNEVKADQKTHEEEQKNKTNDSFKSSKRRVRRGSDPIHNKAQPFS
uniref:CLAVATA3/ESR (CLE)-related protein 45 n=1 Tax=Noccaea caerulescens TaxID=107243 RepID=A0A1J3IEB6_NOCCA